jgi:hypothetical protein
MPDYINGKIYKITSGDLTYIGSTCEPTLARRLSGHVTSHKLCKNGTYGKTSSFQVIETGNYEISLLELYPCNSKDELTARERFYIETNDCVNKRIEGRTKKEYYEANKPEIAKKGKAYREESKIEILERQRIYRETNKASIADKRKVYNEANKDKIAEKQKARYEANKIKK